MIHRHPFPWNKDGLFQSQITADQLVHKPLFTQPPSTLR